MLPGKNQRGGGRTRVNVSNAVPIALDRNNPMAIFLFCFVFYFYFFFLILFYFIYLLSLLLLFLVLPRNSRNIRQQRAKFPIPFKSLAYLALKNLGCSPIVNYIFLNFWIKKCTPPPLSYLNHKPRASLLSKCLNSCLLSKSLVLDQNS